MNLLLIEQDHSIRDLLNDLLTLAVPDASVFFAPSVGDVLIQEIPQFSVIVANVDSIQGLGEWLSRLGAEGALIIQASLTFDEAGAGLTIKSMEWPSHLLCEIDQTETGWPDKILERIRAHGVSLQLRDHVASLFREDESRSLSSWNDVGGEINWVVQMLNHYGDTTGLSFLLDRIPPENVQTLIQNSMPAPRTGKYCSIYFPRSYFGDKGLSQAVVPLLKIVSNEVDTCLELLVRLGHAAPLKNELKLWVLPATDINPPHFRQPFFINHGTLKLILPVDKISSSVDQASESAIRWNISMMLVRLINHFEKPGFAKDWGWFDQALSIWFADRTYGTQKALPRQGFDHPFDNSTNLFEAVRYIQFLENYLGVRRTLQLWKSPMLTPSHAFAQGKLIRPYFDWLAAAYWDDLAEYADKAVTAYSLNHCSCKVWNIAPETESIAMIPAKAANTLAVTVFRQTEFAYPCILPFRPSTALRILESKQTEKHLLMVCNYGHRCRRPPSVDDDNMKFEIHITGRRG